MYHKLPYAKKSLGQHWLDDPDALEDMCDGADVRTGDIVLEIGPGVGTLTARLLQRGAKVIAVEFDRALAEQLPKNLLKHVSAEYAAEAKPEKLQNLPVNLQVVQSDILTFDLNSLPQGYKIAANIPYYLTSNLLRVLSETANPASRVALLVQKEVAERVTAKPGDMSILAVSAQAYWETSLGNVVPAELFTPPPKVDSQILILSRRPVPLFGDMDHKAFFRVVRAGFSSKRKTLRNTLSAGLHMDKSEVEAVLGQVGIDPGLRPEALPITAWVELAPQLAPKQL